MNKNLKIGDLVCLLNKRDSIGYVVDPSGKTSKGTETKYFAVNRSLWKKLIGDKEIKYNGWVNIRWLEGEYKGQGWISIGQETLFLITDEEIIKKFNTNYPFENNNSFKGTMNLLSNDLFNKRSK